MKRLAASSLVAIAVVAAGPANAQSAPDHVRYVYVPYPDGYPPLVRAVPQQPQPMARPTSDGLKLIEAGAVLLSLGGVDVLTSPICVSTLIRSSLHTPCLATTLTVGLSATTVGLVLLLAGVSKRRKYLEWQQSHHVGLVIGRDRAALSFRVGF